MFELDFQKDLQQVISPFSEMRPVESQVKQWNPISAAATEGLSLS